MPNSEEMKEKKKVKLKRAKLNKNKTEEINEKKTKTKKKGRVKKVFKILFFTFLALFIVGVGIVLGVLNSVIESTEQIDLALLKSLKLTSIVLDSEGEQIGQMSAGENTQLQRLNPLRPLKAHSCSTGINRNLQKIRKRKRRYS